jgi:hypothetical protein
VLVNKTWLPRRLLRWVFDSPWWRRHPRLLAHFAALNNTLAMGLALPVALVRGEIGARVLRRFWNPGRWITS